MLFSIYMDKINVCGMSPTDITNIIFMKLLITFFLFRTRPVLVIPKSIRDAFFPYWVINAIHEGWRVPVFLVLVIVQFAKCAPSRRMLDILR